MRGMPEHNYPLFNAAAAEYRNEGFHLISPAENFGGRQDLDWSVYMKEDLDTILYSVEYLIVLPDWERSAGSLLEVAVAQAIGLPVFDAHTRCPVIFSQLVADGGYLAVSPAAQWLTMEANDDDEDDEEYEDEDDDADQNEDEDEGEFYQSDSERESYLDGYHLGFSEGLDKGLTMGKEIAESERAAMADLIQVQSQRITELKEAQNSEIVANAEALQAAADMGYQSGLVNGRLEAEAQNQNRGAVPTGLLDEVLSLLDQAFYSLPEPCDEAVLDGYIDAGQLQENAVLCSRILDVIEELSEYTASSEAEPERESQIKTGGAFFHPTKPPQETAGGSILEEAEALINGDRQATYGHPGRDFADIATFWSTYLGVEVHPHDVWPMMVLLKVSRQKNGYKRDNCTDIAGYAGCGEKIQRWVEEGILPEYHPRRKAAPAPVENEPPF
jgi:hypothetical protein